MRLPDDDLLPAAFDQAFGLPGTERAAHRVQRGAGHLGDILTTDRKIDLDAVLDLAAGLIDEPKQGMGDTFFDLLGRHLDHAGVGFLKAGTDGLQRVGGKGWESLDQTWPCPEGQASTTLSSTAVAVAG